MGIEDFHFDKIKRQKEKGEISSFVKKVETPRMQEAKRIIDLKNKGLLSSANLKAVEGGKGEQKGFKIEEALVRFFETLPGVERAILANPYEDVAQGIDVIIYFKGDATPINLQVTWNPEKTIEDVKPGNVFIKLSQIEADDVLAGNFTRRICTKLKQKIGSFLARNNPQALEALLNARGMDY